MTRTGSPLGPLRLGCFAQTYAWGRVGNASRVGRYWASGSGGSVNPSTTYAELWAGTHPSGPCVVLGEDGAPAGSLLEHVQSHPESLGSGATAAGDIPFLLKVLSVNIALSIQAHPDLALAGELHAARPDLYKDANHKPEMAVALGTFEALCGFRPVSELRAHAAGVPELAAVLGDAAVNGLCSADAGVAATKAAFGALMTADDALVKAQLDRLVARLSTGPDSFNVLSEPLRALLLRLAEQYPGDAGIFCALVLNYLVLADGEAIFLPANTPHAYLAGDCVECMASSDNVVRAGLTPKYRDIGTLLRMLDYASSPPDQLVLRGSKDAGSADGVVARTFKPPVNEFLLQVVSVAPGVADVAAEAVTGPSILIFTAGAADIKGIGKVGEGHAVFLPAQTEMSITASDQGVTYHRAFCVSFP